MNFCICRSNIVTEFIMNRTFLLLHFCEWTKTLLITMNLINEHVKTKFGLENVLLKLYDLDVNENIDLDSDDDLLGIGGEKVIKIKICELTSVMPSTKMDQRIDGASTVEIEENQSRSEAPSPLPSTTHSSSLSLPSTCSSQSSLPSTSSSSSPITIGSPTQEKSNDEKDS